MSKTNKPKHAPGRSPDPGKDLADVVVPGDELLLTWPDASFERVKVLDVHGAADLHRPTRVRVERIEDRDYGANNEDKIIVVPLAHLTPLPY